MIYSVYIPDVEMKKCKEQKLYDNGKITNKKPRLVKNKNIFKFISIIASKNTKQKSWKNVFRNGKQHQVSPPVLNANVTIYEEAKCRFNSSL